MNVSDGEEDLCRRSVPELIKHLWDLYFAMSLDPALAASSEDIRQAALKLEHTRRLAFEITQEGRRKKTRKPKVKQTDEEAARLNWLRAAKAGSHLKH